MTFYKKKKTKQKMVHKHPHIAFKLEQLKQNLDYIW